MTEGSYKQFCPVAMASEVLCNRWTMIIVRELVCGSTRFSDLRRGIPRMSPALLSKRLKELESTGIVARVPAPQKAGVQEYRLTTAGRELEPIVQAMGVWGQRWVDAAPTLENLDPELLMWDIRRGLKTAAMPRRRSVIQFSYLDLPTKKRNYWLVVEAEGDVNVCWIDPGFDVALYVTTDLRTMTAIWLGLHRLRSAIDAQTLLIVGDRQLEETMPEWIGLSGFAHEVKQAPAALSTEPP
jgi:DNA-binding HxlR family transcriptional regulator